MQVQLDHYSIYCFDLDKSIFFYEKILCLKGIPRPLFNFPGYWFDIGHQQQLHLISQREVTRQQLPSTRNIHYAFKTTDIEMFNKHLDFHAVPKIGPKKRPDGIKQIFIQDPDGYWIEITE